MNAVQCIRIVAAVASLLVLPGTLAASRADVEQALSHDGLRKINVKGIDLAYARPGVTLAAYKEGQDRADRGRFPQGLGSDEDWQPV